MTPADADHSLETSQRIPVGVLAALLILCLPAPGWSLKTNLDFRDNQQINRVEGAELSRFYSRRGVITVREATSFRQSWALEGSFQYLTERAGGSELLRNERQSYRPAVTLSYRTDRWSFGTRGDWIRLNRQGAGTVVSESTENRYVGWLNADVTSLTRVSSNISYTSSNQDRLVELDTKQTALSGYVLATQQIGRRFLFDYRFSGTASDLVTRTIYRARWSHDFRLTGSPRFAGGRGTTSFLVRTALANERTEIGANEESTFFREPASGRVILDSTPETSDPLEDPGIPVPALFDGDRDTPTSINLGDSAPIVLEWGGDYRNIRYDFVDSESYASAVLYVDERLLIPELFQWRIFVTDDPDARVWAEVLPDRATVRYREFGTDQQGWEVVLAPDVTGRFFKMVNVKRGETIPDLFVTELEMFVRERSEVAASTSAAQRYELNGNVGYELTSALRVAYQARLERRSFEQSRRDIDEFSQSILTRYALSSAYSMSGIVEQSIRRRPSAPDEDVTTFELSATRKRSFPLSGTLAWNRTLDRGRGLDLTTDALSLRTRWQAAPRLVFGQTLSAGRTQTLFLGTESRSLTMINQVEGSAVRSLWARVRWSERWSSLDLGVGYDRFTEARLDLTWAIAPLLSANSRSRYQLSRLGEVYDSRQTLTWTPLRGGALEPAISGQIYYDSRVEVWEQGLRFEFLWKIRPGLRADGSVQFRRFLLGDTVNRPLTTNFHATWSF